MRFIAASMATTTRHYVSFYAKENTEAALCRQCFSHSLISSSETLVLGKGRGKKAAWKNVILSSRQLCFKTQGSRWVHGQDFLARTVLQLRHFAAPLSSAPPYKSSGIVGAKLFHSLCTSVATFQLQARCPSSSSQRHSAEIECKASWSFLRSQVCRCGAGYGIGSLNVGTNVAKFLWQPNHYVGGIYARHRDSSKIPKCWQPWSQNSRGCSQVLNQQSWGAKCNWHGHTEIVEELSLLEGYNTKT